jgi:hypothetical protein
MSSTPTKTNPFSSVEDDTYDDFAPKPPANPIIRAQGSQPTPAVATIERTEQKAMVTKLAEESGFTINNFDEKPIPARLAPGANTFLKTVRLQVSDWNRFQVWCHENGYSHWKGFHVLTSTLPAKNR